MASIPIRLLSLLLATLVLSGCYLHRDASALRVTVAVPELPAGLDPQAQERTDARYLHAALFDALTWIDEKGEVQPALAVSWKPLGPTTWEIKLREGVRFSTGEEFNAYTVAYNVRRVLRRDLHSPVLQYVPTLIRANPRDLYTVVIFTRRTDPLLPRRLASLYMVPSDYLQRVGEEEFARAPVGTGPWKVTSYEPGVQLTLEAHKGSWRGPPQLRYVDLRTVPAESDRAQALLDGTADMALDLNIEHWNPLVEHGFNLEEVPVAAAKFIVLDTFADDAPLGDVKVRQALNYAVNKEHLVRDVVGTGTPLEGQAVGREGYGWSPRVQFTYPYDPAEAQRLLAEAGFSAGFGLRIYYPESPDGSVARELQSIVDDLARVRVRATLVPVNRASYVQRRQGGSLTPAYYDTFPYYPGLDASAVMDMFGLEKTDVLQPTYDNDDFDEIYKLTRTEMNPSLRLQALQVSMGILAEYPPGIYLYQPSRIHAMRRAIYDFKALPNLLIDWDRLSRQ